ncbi:MULTISPECIES: hypothetical protein [Moorena]|uniref:HicB-like antitoxin of toxin-antitoxin system domain-containing protein n=1 Tax=Moorena producens 3L TaxID=489825 RepID=F4XSZ4_9CYAN|nr:MULTISPECIES: hypothetical protein [Moorena]EGJ32334.1 hypothetical protein LYNGBM3L_26580 [Moorena producens 3L]NEP31202.1 hypothetical protein [Moorena sp. SIO3B2]NEP65925.1 hypothetical protein [Moorena sp. SIO3A5]NES43320.1 hypothetical protein [Moorena sp. SIO2C4]NET63544.1 hypothetical protein [Moorena sp. SIO1G6]
MKVNPQHYTYSIKWSKEDGDFVGLCAEFPSLSHLDTSGFAALQGITNLVAEVLEDMEASGEPIPQPLAEKKYTGQSYEDERMIQAILQEREGGEREVESPVGYVDLLTDDYVIEVKHVKVWKDGTKVLLYAPYFPGRKPRVHLFGGYSKDFRTLVENSFETLGITTTWEREPF